MEAAVNPSTGNVAPLEAKGWGMPFREALVERGLGLVRGETSTIQINLGRLCNQACSHCHLEAGPHRREIMTEETAIQVIAFAGRAGFSTADITGGAPELNPNLGLLIEGLSSRLPRVMLRSNLTALSDPDRSCLLDLLKDHRVAVVASFPSLQPVQTDAQRGNGVFRQSIRTLQRLNAIGYGLPGSGLELDLVSNPSGAFLPPSQEAAERRFRQELERRWGIYFNHLFAFANVPLGRYRSWLEKSGNLNGYLQKLASSFNPATLTGVMCRTLISVSWDGFLYDCDFNLALDLPFSGQRVYVSEMAAPPEPDTPIMIGDHCYTCTAGRGFT